MCYHSHEHREEVWTVVEGRGKTIVDGVETKIKTGDVVKIPKGAKHTIIADTNLKVIEVQVGEGISVDDKTKFEFNLDD